MLKPPEGYSSWLDCAIASMDTRMLHLLSIDDGHGWGRAVQREEMRQAAREELDALREHIRELEAGVVEATRLIRRLDHMLDDEHLPWRFGVDMAPCVNAWLQEYEKEDQ